MSFHLLPDGGSVSQPSNYKRVAFKPHVREDGRLDATKRGYKANPMLSLFRAVLNRDKICSICKFRLSVVVDHKITRSSGGADTMSNCQGLCKRCHDVKTYVCDGSFGRPKQAYSEAIRCLIYRISLCNSPTHNAIDSM